MIGAKDIEAAIADLLPVMSRMLRNLRSITGTRELTWSQVAILSRLRRGEAMTLAALTRAEDAKLQPLESVLVELEEKGLVRRRSFSAYRRQDSFVLTAEGCRTRFEVRLAKHGSIMDACAELTTAELETLISATTLIGLAKHEWLRAALAKLTSAEQETLISAVDLIRHLENS
ncbi:hypothetical protein [Rhizobium sp. NPDC090279]|uniref:hypothetical protein n=1 Tax=Rhizobium sp. NPDC090279 TaxID=3364499 RepID=UPI00383BEF71